MVGGKHHSGKRDNNGTGTFRKEIRPESAARRRMAYRARE